MSYANLGDVKKKATARLKSSPPDIIMQIMFRG